MSEMKLKHLDPNTPTYVCMCMEALSTQVSMRIFFSLRIGFHLSFDTKGVVKCNGWDCDVVPIQLYFFPTQSWIQNNPSRSFVKLLLEPWSAT